MAGRRIKNSARVTAASDTSARASDASDASALADIFQHGPAPNPSSKLRRSLWCAATGKFPGKAARTSYGSQLVAGNTAQDAVLASLETLIDALTRPGEGAPALLDDLRDTMLRAKKPAEYGDVLACHATLIDEAFDFWVTTCRQRIRKKGGKAEAVGFPDAITHFAAAAAAHMATLQAHCTTQKPPLDVEACTDALVLEIKDAIRAALREPHVGRGHGDP